MEADDQTPSVLDRVPFDIWHEIFSYLQYGTLKRMHIVSKGFCNILAARQFNKMLFRPDEDDLVSRVDAGSSQELHPFLVPRDEYTGWYRRQPYEDVWLFCRGKRGLGETCVQPDHAPCHSLHSDLDIWRCEKKWHFKQKWQSIAGESAYWPPVPREERPNSSASAGIGAKFVTVFQYCKTDVLSRANSEPREFLRYTPRYGPYSSWR